MTYNPEEDFIKRTKKLLEQYESNTSNEEKYEVSLLLNCCVGLLLLPKERHFSKINNNLLLNSDWGISESDIIITENNPKSVKNTIRHLRNAIAHDGFKFLEPEDGNEIEKIKFTDINFSATITVNQLRIFINKFIQTADPSNSTR